MMGPYENESNLFGEIDSRTNNNNNKTHILRERKRINGKRNILKLKANNGAKNERRKKEKYSEE